MQKSPNHLVKDIVKGSNLPEESVLEVSTYIFKTLSDFARRPWELCDGSRLAITYPGLGRFYIGKSKIENFIREISNPKYSSEENTERQEGYKKMLKTYDKYLNKKREFKATRDKYLADNGYPSEP